MKMVKKQHYVPRFYLEGWCIPGKEQIHLYDKVKKEIRCNNIKDVACEGHFYDINLKDYYSDDRIKMMNDSGTTIDGWLQTIEKMLSDWIEGPISCLFKEIINKARNSTPWEIKGCCFISDEQKLAISIYLAYQYIRTKKIRNDLIDTSERIKDKCRKMGIPEERIKNLTLTKKQASEIHIRMLNDEENIQDIANCFCSLVWVMGLNKSKTKIFTSDNPIGIKGHDIKRPTFLGTGLTTPGVEVFFPLSPDLLLIMLDGDYHKRFMGLQGRYVEVDESNVKSYNSILYWQANRSIISCDGDFSVIYKLDKICK